LVELASAASNAPGRPFFLVHPVGGEVLSYVSLARQLAADRPVYGVQAQAPGHQTLAEMAETYLRAIRRMQPAGPYFLGGWSLGGVVAFEMARQLEDAGATCSLVLIDAYAPVSHDGQRISEREIMTLFTQDLARLPGLAFALPPDLGQCLTLDGLAAEAARLGILPPGLDRRELERRFAIFSASFRALESYPGGPCSAPILLVRASLPTPPSNAPDLGWSRFTRHPVAVHDLPGDHYTLLEPSQVPPLAALLRQHLASSETAGLSA
jgi:thioesterase domain-containing protein